MSAEYYIPISPSSKHHAQAHASKSKVAPAVLHPTAYDFSCSIFLAIYAAAIGIHILDMRAGKQGDDGSRPSMVLLLTRPIRFFVSSHRNDLCTAMTKYSA